MFRRSNFAATCKTYVKYVNTFKTKLQDESGTKLSSNAVRKCEKILQRFQGCRNGDTVAKLSKFRSDTKCRVNFEESKINPELAKRIENVFKKMDTNKIIQSAPGKYRQTLLVLQEKLDTFSKKKAIQSAPEKYRKTLTALQDKFNVKFNVKFQLGKNAIRNPAVFTSVSFTALQDKLNVKFQLPKIAIRNPAVFTSASLLGLNSSPVTISGYSSYDLAILRQLGVADSNTTENVELDPSATNTIPDNNVEITNIDMTTASPDFPHSLFDTQGIQYQSIFDNMPPEDARNDIYTTLYNTFNQPRHLNESESHHTSSEFIEETVTESMIETDLSEEIIINNDLMNGTINQHQIYMIDKDSTLTEITNLGGGTHETVTSVPGVAFDTNESLAASAVDTSVIGDGASQISGMNANDNVRIDSITDPVVEAIPEPPPVPDVAAELASQLNALGEPTFAALGLGGWTPVGIVQNCFEYLHVTLGIPWWEAIAIGTLVIRFMMFPLVVIAQRNAAKMNNHLPQMQVIQLKMTEARQSGNQLETARYSQELMQFMSEKNVNPFKNMIVPLAQMPVFISFFVGLRQMANVPVESLRTGGMFWFTDLTVPDQFFVLPVITSLTLWATIELGTDSAKLSSQNLQTMKYVLRALPFVILPFTVNFPGVILCYWVSSNFISLAQVGFLKIPSVRDYFKIDPHLKHDPQKLPVPSKGFVGGIKDSWTNIKITKELEERRRLDELQFNRAGKGPLVKTYKYDPTKQVSPKDPNAISAKNR